LDITIFKTTYGIGVFIANITLHILTNIKIFIHKKTVYSMSLASMVQELKYKRDALLLAHEELKLEGDNWNKCVIILSLSTGMFESMKLQMGWQSNAMALVPIALSSIIAIISALIKFKNFTGQSECILQSASLLTHTLNVARNETDLSPSLMTQYNEALEKLETSIYPDLRKKYLKMSQNNLIAIYRQERRFQDGLELVNVTEANSNDSI